MQLRQIAANALRSTGPAKASLSAGLAAALGRLKQIPDPALKANMIGQLRQYSGNPNLCAELERISSSDPDPQVREIAADLLK